jgi:PAS domain S-box-containing protein
MDQDRRSSFASETREALLHALDEAHTDGASPAALPRRVRELLARLALDEMVQFVAVLAPDGTLLEVNEPALAAGGLPPEEVLGRPFWDARWWAVSPEIPDQVRAAVARAAGGELVRYETEVLARGAGRILAIDFSLRPVASEDGLPVLLVAEGRDITSRKAAEAKLARKNAELEGLYRRVKELDELKTRFFANVSHELRTPLALVLGPIERLLAAPDLPRAHRRDLEVVERNARTLLRHVNDLLEVARLEAGKGGLHYATVDLGGLVRLAAGHFEAHAAERRITLRVEAPASLLAEVDRDQAERVLLNLLGNAFQFTPEAGRVRVSVAGAGGRARLEVADSGPGIPPADRQRVFERFQQLDEGSGARRSGGLGLGLAIARELVELHGGRIRVETAPEGGALLAVELPLSAPAGAIARPAAPARGDARARGLVRPPEAPSAAAPAGGVDEGGDAPLVLVVEDNPEMNAFLRGALAPRWRTASAADGAEGLAQARALRPDLVLTDVMMPGTSGADLLAALRADPELAEIPVVLLTAKADDALRAKLLAEGAQDYVAKPVAVAELRARIGNLVAMKRARDVLRGELAGQVQDVERLARELAQRKRELSTALDAMRFARGQAERASAQKTTLIQLVSHELRTPLAALLLQVERLRRDAAGFAPRQVDRLRRVHGAAVRLVELVESLLEFVRIEAGGLELQPAPLELVALAEDVMEELRPRADQKQLALGLAAPTGLPPLVADARLVRLALLNLVSNAIKFTDAGGIAVAVAASDGRHRLEVRDTGRGIAPEDQAKIFEPFEQLEALARKHTPGVGLGLTLVRELVQALGGTIRIESALGAGSTFTLELPSRPPGAHGGSPR